MFVVWTIILRVFRHEFECLFCWVSKISLAQLEMRRRGWYDSFIRSFINSKNKSKYRLKQELSYRKHIARQLRTQFVEGISVTLKSTLRVTQGHWKRNHWTDHTRLLDELLDVEYYRDFKMWSEVTQGHWKWYHLKVWVRFPTFSYPNPNPTPRVISQGHWKWRRSIDHMRLSIGPPL